jgi:hypothetical protein
MVAISPSVRPLGRHEVARATVASGTTLICVTGPEQTGPEGAAENCLTRAVRSGFSQARERELECYFEAGIQAFFDQPRVNLEEN